MTHTDNKTSLSQTKADPLVLTKPTSKQKEDALKEAKPDRKVLYTPEVRVNKLKELAVKDAEGLPREHKIPGGSFTVKDAGVDNFVINYARKEKYFSDIDVNAKTGNVTWIREQNFSYQKEFDGKIFPGKIHRDSFNPKGIIDATILVDEMIQQAQDCKKK